MVVEASGGAATLVSGKGTGVSGQANWRDVHVRSLVELLLRARN